MKIKGFDKNLCCRGFQFEIGKTYDTGAEDEDLKLCSDTVFHYCDSLQKVHKFYNCDTDNRYCEIEVLGKEITDGDKCGSNKIKILREIKGEELNPLLGKINGNTGLFNSGDRNSGDRNSGDRNSGNRNSGNRNSGDCNSGYRNSGNRNSGNWNSGDCNSGNCNSGYHNSGNRNSGNWNNGDCNSGNWNSGDCNSGDWNSGNRNSGNRNSGYRNSGDRNSGYWNSCDGSNGVFCTKEPTIRIFDVESNMTLSEFRNSKYYTALMQANFPLTEWAEYTEEEKANDKKKELIDGYLKIRTYKEACAIWWKNTTEENKKIIMSMPNFNKKKFKQITGIDVSEDRI